MLDGLHLESVIRPLDRMQETDTKWQKSFHSKRFVTILTR
jgi:hypothetical protein